MDADYDPSQDQGMLGLKATKKKKNKFAQALARNKPTFDPGESNTSFFIILGLSFLWTFLRIQQENVIC